MMTRLLIALVTVMLLSNSALAFTTQAQNLSYSIGFYLIARNLGFAKRHFLDPNAVAQGLRDATAGKPLKYSDTSIRSFSRSYHAADTAARAKIMSANKDLISYAEGANFGKSMLSTKLQYDFDRVAQGIVDGLTGAHPALTEQQMQALVSSGRNAQKSGENAPKK